MEIIIDRENRIRATDEYFAPMRKTKQGKKGIIWREYKWFTSLECCVEYLARKSLCSSSRALTLGEFLAEYKAERVKMWELVNIDVDKTKQK